MLRKIPILRKIKRKIRLLNNRRMRKISPNKYENKISKIYKKRIGKNINWNNPTTYTEKMQWEKLYDNNPLKSELSDKYLVREWVKEKIGEKYLIDIYGVWDSFSEIDFKKLPKSFVLKTNHGSGTIYIVKDKNKMDYNEVKNLFDDWMQMDYAFCTGFELHYSKIRRRIIAEKYIETDNDDLQDYKFLCFDGKPYFCWVDVGRFSNHKRNVYDLDWNLQRWNQSEYGNTGETIPKPNNFSEMIKIAEKLCQGFSHVRVDLYNVKGKIYFGEMTFTNGSGFDKIVPDEYDLILGNMWKLDMRKENIFGDKNE